MAHHPSKDGLAPSQTGRAELGERITRLSDLVGGKRRLAQVAGIRESQLYRYIRGDNVPSLLVAASLARAAGVPLEWLAYGRQRGGEGEPGSVAEATAPYGNGDGWIRIPQLEGGEPPLLFRERWLSELGAAAEDLLLATVPDDTMEPTLHSGELVLVDQRQTQPGPAGLFLFEMAGSPAPRRVAREPSGRLHLQCDNPLYPDLAFSREESRTLTVLGRIRWSGRRLG